MLGLQKRREKMSDMAIMQNEKIADIQARLQEPFARSDIEWRIARAKKNKKGELVATVLAYVTNRAIMDRLDEVFGVNGWYNEYKEWHGNSQLCGITAIISGRAITKWDGADNTNYEATKGGLSDSMKRAAVQWGIGRYLYKLTEGIAKVYEYNSDNGAHKTLYEDKQTGEKIWYSWSPPELPNWAVKEEPFHEDDVPSNEEMEKVIDEMFDYDLNDSHYMWINQIREKGVKRKVLYDGLKKIQSTCKYMKKEGKQ